MPREWPRVAANAPGQPRRRDTLDMTRTQPCRVFSRRLALAVDRASPSRSRSNCSSTGSRHTPPLHARRAPSTPRLVPRGPRIWRESRRHGKRANGETRTRTGHGSRRYVRGRPRVPCVPDSGLPARIGRCVRALVSTRLEPLSQQAWACRRDRRGRRRDAEPGRARLAASTQRGHPPGPRYELRRAARRTSPRRSSS
jgi:hypothetical protein